MYTCIEVINQELEMSYDIFGNQIFPFKRVGTIVDKKIIRNPILLRPIVNPLYILPDQIHIIKMACMLVKIYTLQHRFVTFLTQGKWDVYNDLIDKGISMESKMIQFAEYTEEWLKVYPFYSYLMEEWYDIYIERICSVCSNVIIDNKDEYVVLSTCEKIPYHYYHKKCICSSDILSELDGQCLGCKFQKKLEDESNRLSPHFEPIKISVELIHYNEHHYNINSPLNYYLTDPTQTQSCV
jgi:hypothetical protein